MDEYDFLSQQDDLTRRQKLIDALMAGQPTAPGQGSTGAFGNALLNILGKNRAQEQQGQLNQETAQFRQRYRESLGNETNQFLDRMNGTPEKMPVDGYGPATPGTAANPREAIIRAMTSQLPEMQAMGKAQMGSLGQRPEYGFQAAGDTMYRTNKHAGTVEPVGNIKKADWQDETRTIDGRAVPGQKNALTGEWKALGGGGQTINIGDKGNAELLKEVVPVVKGAREQVLAAQQGLDASQRIMQALNDPSVQTGFGASAVTGVAALGAKLGLNGPDGVAKTQALASDLARNTLAAGQTMKGSFSDKDIQFLTDVTLGKIDFTKEALRDVAALAYQANHNGMLNAMDQYKSASQFKGMEGVAGLYPLPPVRWDATISDNPAFQKDDTGRLRYMSSFSQGERPAGRTNSQGRRRMTVQEFLAGGQD